MRQRRWDAIAVCGMCDMTTVLYTLCQPYLLILLIHSVTQLPEMFLLLQF